MLRLDLLAFNTDAEYDALFGQVWQLSRESMTKPAGVRTWLHRRRLDTALRGVLLDPGSPTIRQLRKALAEAELAATPQDLAQWFRAHLGPPVATLPIPARTAVLAGNTPAPDAPAPGETAAGAGAGKPTQAPGPSGRGAGLRDLLDAGLRRPGTGLVLIGKGGREVARAALAAGGEIEWQGRRYRSPSDRAFVALLGVAAFNGWRQWHAELPHGRSPLVAVRARLQGGTGTGPEVPSAPSKTRRA